MNKVYWTMGNGQRISVDYMTDMHVFNTLNLLYRKNHISRMMLPGSIGGARRQLKNIIRYGTLTAPKRRRIQGEINPMAFSTYGGYHG